MKKASLVVMIIFYLLAGLNHFIRPAGYYAIIPPYLPYAHLINIISGLAEILFAILLLVPATKKYACYAIIAMLVAFIPAHVYMIQVGFCIMDHCLPAWALWVRLIIMQPLLILWAWRNSQ